MRRYKVIVLKSAQKEVRRFPPKDRERIAEAITSLQFDPYLGKQLQGEHEGKWSLRVWPYRNRVYDRERDRDRDGAQSRSSARRVQVVQCSIRRLSSGRTSFLMAAKSERTYPGLGLVYFSLGQ